MKDQNFELISAAQDSQGDEAAVPWFEKANATFTQIVDDKHTISALYNMVNVPTGVWVDEEGRIVRPNEVAYSSDVTLTLGGKTLSAAGSSYVAALRDWVAKGAESEYVMSAEEIAAKVSPLSSNDALAAAEFQLGVYLQSQGDDEGANRHWAKAQELRPESWNYHRQDWAFTPKEAGGNWMKKFQSMEENEDYYAPLELPAAETD